MSCKQRVVILNFLIKKGKKSLSLIYLFTKPIECWIKLVGLLIQRQRFQECTQYVSSCQYATWKIFNILSEPMAIKIDCHRPNTVQYIISINIFIIFKEIFNCFYSLLNLLRFWKSRKRKKKIIIVRSLLMQMDECKFILRRKRL